MNKNTKKTLGFAALVLLAAGGAWALGMFEQEDPVVAEMKLKAQQVFGENGTGEDRRAFFEQTRELTEDQRRQLREWGRPQMQQMMAKRMRELFATPPAELADRILQARANRPPRGDRGGGGGGPPGGRGGDMTDAERDARRKGMLDRIDPGMRAQFGELRSMVNEELEARGEEPLRGRDLRRLMGGGRGGPPRG
ncbi:MAG: hypothetical protein AAFV43_10960 [Planctomycetota bacterium]